MWIMLLGCAHRATAPASTPPPSPIITQPPEPEPEPEPAPPAPCSIEEMRKRSAREAQMVHEKELKVRRLEFEGAAIQALLQKKYDPIATPLGNIPEPPFTDVMFYSELKLAGTADFWQGSACQVSVEQTEAHGILTGGWAQRYDLALVWFTHRFAPELLSHDLGSRAEMRPVLVASLIQELFCTWCGREGREAMGLALRVFTQEPFVRAFGDFVLVQPLAFPDEPTKNEARAWLTFAMQASDRALKINKASAEAAMRDDHYGYRKVYGDYLTGVFYRRRLEGGDRLIHLYREYMIKIGQKLEMPESSSWVP
jgi:hypothetical protein